MTHASIPVEERRKSGVSDSLIRLSVGVEDVEDLISDLQKRIGFLSNIEALTFFIGNEKQQVSRLLAWVNLEVP